LPYLFTASKRYAHHPAKLDSLVNGEAHLATATALRDTHRTTKHKRHRRGEQSTIKPGEQMQVPMARTTISPISKENGEPKFAVCIGELGLSALPLLPIVPTIGMPDTVSIIARPQTKEAA
jgi:hypothetical protein